MAVSPPCVPTPVNDVLAIVSATDALKIDAGAVIDVIGGMGKSSLDALPAAGVSDVTGTKVNALTTTAVGTATATAAAAPACFETCTVCALNGGGTHVMPVSFLHSVATVSRMLCLCGQVRHRHLVQVQRRHQAPLTSLAQRSWRRLRR